MMRHLSALLVAAAVVMPCPCAEACIWDRDTLAMERQEFPSALELIAGKFLRHSRDFYAWRVEDRRARLVTHPGDLRAMDDLAAALDKLGRHQEAIALMEQAEALEPDRYETQANLGTFYIHGGQLERGLGHIQRAIAINPQAHFGREVYQARLVEYLLARPHRELPLHRGLRDHIDGPSGFAGFVLGHRDRSATPKGQLPAALKGVLGMMRFGDHTSPILLEALGDLLVARGARRLAARAYLRAAAGVDDEAVRERYRVIASGVLSNQEGVSVDEIESALAAELAEAEAWYAGVRRDELAWIADPEVDPDGAFHEKYYQAPTFAGAPEPEQAARAEPSPSPGSGWWWWLWLVPVAGIPLTLLARRRRRR